MKRNIAIEELAVIGLGDFWEEPVFGFSLWNGKVVVWDEDYDTRIFDFLDSMGYEFTKGLVLAGESKACLTLRWSKEVPEKYAEGKTVDVGNDTWVISSSELLSPEGVALVRPAL